MTRVVVLPAMGVVLQRLFPVMRCPPADNSNKKGQRMWTITKSHIDDEEVRAAMGQLEDALNAPGRIVVTILSEGGIKTVTSVGITRKMLADIYAEAAVQFLGEDAQLDS